MSDDVAASLAHDVAAVQRLLARERLSIDQCDEGRTAFFSHLGAAHRLVPGPWIAHRDLIYALALANLSPAQRASLGHALRVEHGREFGVGRSVLETASSGLPFGGASLLITPRGEGPTCLYTWALGPGATPRTCEWLLLRAQPAWAQDDPPRKLDVRGLETLSQLGGDVLMLVPSATAARQVADLIRGKVPFTAHARYLPHVFDEREEHDAGAAIRLWPHDALDARSLRSRPVSTVVLVAAPEEVRRAAERWAANHGGPEVVRAACPGRVGREELLTFWRACGRPKVLLRGDPAWVAQAQGWLSGEGVQVAARSEGTQLGLF